MEVDSGSEAEEENTVEELQELLQSDSDEDEEISQPLDPLETDWSEDFNSFRGQKESFQEQSGPQIEGTCPLELFTQIWDETVMDLITHETNKYAWETIAAASETGISARSRLNQWVETSVSELYRLMAIFILMGICVRSRIGQPGFWECHHLENL